MKNKKNIKTIIVVLVVILGMGYLLFGTGGKAEKIVAGEYDTFAQCLKEEGLVMYGSATCSQCARQRRSFGNSFHFIGEIECDPRNEGYVKGQCLDDISHTPTWTQEDDDGNVLHRFESGFVALEVLSEQSGCPLIKDGVESL